MTKHIYTIDLPQYITLDALTLLKNIVDNDTVSTNNKEEYEKLEKDIQKIIQTFDDISIDEYINIRKTMLHQHKYCPYNLDSNDQDILAVYTIKEFINMDNADINFKIMCDHIQSYISMIKIKHSINEIKYDTVNIGLFENFSHDITLVKHVYNLIEKYENLGYFNSFYNHYELDFVPDDGYTVISNQDYANKRRSIAIKLIEKYYRQGRNYNKWYGLEHEKKAGNTWKMKALKALLLLPDYRENK
jgi:hypothetical protein